MGLSNTAGVLAGVFGTVATGYILQRGSSQSPISLAFLKFLILVRLLTLNSILVGSWGDVFKVAVVLYIIGTIVWNLFATGEKILD